jgi:hypothetical protein
MISAGKRWCAHEASIAYQAGIGQAAQQVDNAIHRALAEIGRVHKDETTLNLTTPLVRKHINPFGKYHFDLDRMRQTEEASVAQIA